MHGQKNIKKTTHKKASKCKNVYVALDYVYVVSWIQTSCPYVLRYTELQLICAGKLQALKESAF